MAGFKLMAAAIVAVLASTGTARASEAPRPISSAPVLPAECQVAGAGAPNADFEADIAVNPVDADHLVAVGQVKQERGFASLAIQVATSRDGGRTWSTPLPILGQIAEFPPSGLVSDADGRGALVTFDYISSDLAPDGRTLYVTWAQPRDTVDGPPHQTIRVARSRDGGETWTLVANPSHSTAAVSPSLAVDRSGEVAVTFYDMRRDQSGDGEWTADVVLARSGDGGESWTERRVAGPMDLHTAAPLISGGLLDGALILGPTFGLEGLPRGFVAAFPASRPVAVEGPLDRFFVKVAGRLPGDVEPRSARCCAPARRRAAPPRAHCTTTQFESFDVFPSPSVAVVTTASPAASAAKRPRTRVEPCSSVAARAAPR